MRSVLLVHARPAQSRLSSDRKLWLVDGGSASVARCKVLGGRTNRHLHCRYAEAQHYLQQSLSMAKTLGDCRMEAAVLSNLALAAPGG
jgi:hypothetical protein